MVRIRDVAWALAARGSTAASAMTAMIRKRKASLASRLFFRLDLRSGQVSILMSFEEMPWQVGELTIQSFRARRPFLPPAA